MTNRKLVIPTILTATVLVASMFALMPVQKASTVHTTLLNSVKSTTLFPATTLTASTGTGPYLMLYDGAGKVRPATIEVNFLTVLPTGLAVKVITAAAPATWTDVTSSVLAFPTSTGLGATIPVAHIDQSNILALALVSTGTGTPTTPAATVTIDGSTT